MMNRPLSTIGLLIAVVLPVHALAYVAPEDALNDKTYTTRFYDPPPTQRDTNDRQAEQQRISAERRDAELAKIKPVAEEEPMHAAAPTKDTATDIDTMIELMHLLQGNTNTQAPVTTEDARVSLDPVTKRLLIRAEAQHAAAERASLIQSIMGSTNGTLHSGAPLADTGPTTVFITLAIVGAVGETLRRVRKKEVIS